MKNYSHIKDCWNALKFCKTREDMVDVVATFPIWSGTWTISPEEEEDHTVLVTNDWYDGQLDDYFTDEEVFDLTEALDETTDVRTDFETPKKVYVLTHCAAEENYTPEVFTDKEIAMRVLSDWYNAQIENYAEAIYDSSCGETFCEIIWQDDTYDVVNIFDCEVH